MVNLLDKVGQKLSRCKTTGAGSSDRQPVTSQSGQPHLQSWTFPRPNTSRATTRVALSDTSSIHGDSRESLVEESRAGPSEGIDMTTARSLPPTTRLPTATVNKDRRRAVIGSSLNRKGENMQPFDRAKWEKERVQLRSWRQKMDDEDRDRKCLQDIQSGRGEANIGLALPMHPPRPPAHSCSNTTSKATNASAIANPYRVV